MKKKNYEKIHKKIDLLENVKILLLNFNFALIYTIQKMLVLLKNNLNCLEDSIFECFFKESNFQLLLIFVCLFV